MLIWLMYNRLYTYIRLALTARFVLCANKTSQVHKKVADAHIIFACGRTKKELLHITHVGAAPYDDMQT